MTQAQLRERIIRRLNKMRRDLVDLIADKEWWNNNRTEHPPFDVGFERMELHYVEQSLKAWYANDIDAVNRWNDKLVKLSKTLDAEDD